MYDKKKLPENSYSAIVTLLWKGGGEYYTSLDLQSTFSKFQGCILILKKMVELLRFDSATATDMARNTGK